VRREGIFREMKQRSFYEKPSEKRVREKAEAMRRLDPRCFHAPKLAIDVLSWLEIVGRHTTLFVKHLHPSTGSSLESIRRISFPN
jgi:hypothetical protein